MSSASARNAMSWSPPGEAVLRRPGRAWAIGGQGRAVRWDPTEIPLASSIQRSVRMTIDELEAFVTVARTSNIGAAAKRLGVPQATLSDRLRHLEDRLGRLFQRRSRPPWVTLTELGARLLPDAIEAVDAATRLSDPRTVPLRRPAVRIGVNQSVEHTWLFEWLARLRRQH